MKKLILLIVLSTSLNLFGQVYSNKIVGEKNSELIDSLKTAEYPYVLPIWGDKATKAGFKLPYSAGISVQYIAQESELIINNLQVGFNHNQMRDMSEIIRFDNAKSKASGLNFRPDIWIFPFLNIYGIYAQSSPSTQVDFGIYVPDSAGNWNNVINLETKAEFKATTAGFGVTPTIGIGGGWFALDMNFTWSDIAELDKPAFAYVFGPRLGKTFRFKDPVRHDLSFWVGGFRLKLNTGTTGDIPLTDLMDVNGLQQKVDAGQVRVDDAAMQVDSWWNGLSSAEQRNPVNVAKHETANRALETAGGFLNNIDESLNDSETASVQYSLDKKPKDMWNFIVGTQYQYNMHWMIRAEYGFLGTRDQIIFGLQYRFGL